MNRARLFISNSVVMAFQQVVLFAAGLIIPRFFLTAYGSEVNGLIVSITQFIAYFALVEAGISGISTYALYKPLAEKNIPAINGILSASNRFYRQSGYIFIALVLLLAILYPFLVQRLVLSGFQVGIIVFCLGTSAAMDFFTLSRYRVLLTADQRSYVISLSSIVATVIRTVIVVVLTRLQVDIMWLHIFLVFSVFGRSFVLWYYTARNYKYIDYAAPPDKTALKDRWDVLYLQLLGGVQGAAPIIIATVFLGLTQVSVYSIYNLVIAGINGILGIFISGLSASFGDVIARKQQNILREASREFEHAYYMLITVCYGTALLTILPFVRIYTSGITDADYIIPAIGFLFVLNGFLYNLKTPQGMLVIAAGMFRQTRWQTTTQALIALAGAVVFVQYWGLYGILIALILSNVYRDIDLLFFVPQRITGVSYKQTLRYIMVALANFMLVVFCSASWKPEISTVSGLVLYGLGVLICLSAVVLISNYAVDRRNVTNIMKRIHSSCASFRPA